MIAKQCKNCRKDFLVFPYRATKARYCSSKCRETGWLKACLLCEKTFRVVPSTKDQAYCTISCVNLSKKGRSVSENTKRLISSHSPRFWLGKKMSSKSREKMSQILLGKTGSSARNWQGGKTSANALVRSSSEMRVWREAVFKRDNYTCRNCSARGGEGRKVLLHADHVKPFAYFPNLRFTLSNGQTLCIDCHRKTDTYAGKAILNYGIAQ